MTKRLVLPLAAAALLIPLAAAAHAQTTAGASNPQSSYEGVSNPPADDTIETTPDTQPAAPRPKPMPGSPAVNPSASGSTRSATTPAYADDDIVSTTTAPAPSTPAAYAPPPGSSTPHLIGRPQNPDDDIVGVIPSPSSQLAEGTDIRVRLLEALSTRTTQDGTPFRAQVAADVYKEGRVVIPMGSELRGRVISVSQGHRFGTPATLRLRPEFITLPDGSSYHLYAQAVHVSESGTRTDSEGGIQPTSHLTKNLVEYGAATGGGAATGAVLGGPAGAAAGAIVGAGVITTHLLLQKPQQAEVAQGAEVTFSLTEPMDLVPTRN